MYGQHLQQQSMPVNTELLKTTGVLKFFYENDHYGFMVGDTDGKDVFFHFDDLKHTNLTKEHLL